ncbi:MAG TPA: methyltransferase domain-containing protein [Solirubrobacterales bacterium]|nr:methyltransferase domain-containing protein [Solirubrobacterales bacterium]
MADAPGGGPVFEGPSLRLRVAVWMAEAIEWVLRHHRLAKALYAAAEGNGRLSARLLRGEGRECPCCGGHFERMSQRRLAGFGGICPRCRSHPRHRAIALLLARGDLPGHRLLHFAPEPLFDPVFARLREIERTTADLYAPADLALDITKMNLADGSFDLILCSHVLEHVPDDRAAMSELRRVLAPGGLALVLTPYRPEVATYEDPAITAPLDRMVAFGQQDHVRIYGVDLADRLRDAGFEVEDRTPAELFEDSVVRRAELDPDEHLFLCRAPAAL